MELVAALPSVALYIMAGATGAILGSFANVCIWRMPRGESVVRPPSHCTACGRRLSWWENVPVFSYFILRARCRGCRAAISLRYPAVETAMTLLSLLAWRHFGQPHLFFIYVCLLILPMLIVTVIDIEHYIIPDSISLPGIGAGFVVHLFVEGGRGSYPWAAVDSLAGILVGGGSLYLVALAYEKLRGQEGLGGGDVKLIAMLGAFFGWRAALLILLVSSFLGSIVGLAVMVAYRKDLKHPIPFGPFLAAAGVLHLFLGRQIIAWYTGLF